MDSTTWDIAFEREYKEAYQDWFERISTPEGMFLLDYQKKIETNTEAAIQEGK